MTTKKTGRLAIAIVLSTLTGASPLFALEGGYKDGFYLETTEKDFSLKTNLFLQFQHQYLHVDGQGNTNGFQIRRGRLAFSGNAFSEDLTYKFEFEFVGGQTNNASEAVAYTGPNLRDGYVNYNFKNGLEIRVGQFKAPFNLEELVSDASQEFVDRSLSNDAFTFNRDLGLALHGWLREKRFGYSFYAMNQGSNQNVANRDNELLLGGRFVYNILGDHGLTMGDPENSEEPQLRVAVASNFNRVGAPTAADMSMIASTGDVAFRYRGFSTLGAGYYLHNQSTTANTLGFLGQAGYFIIPEHFELVARFDGVIPTSAGVANGYEASGGLGSYFKGHRLKIISDYSVLINSPLVLGVGGVAGVNNVANIAVTGGAPGFVQGQNDHRVRTQLQLFF